jgi:hypothetical protein
MRIANANHIAAVSCNSLKQEVVEINLNWMIITHRNVLQNFQCATATILGAAFTSTKKST